MRVSKKVYAELPFNFLENNSIHVKSNSSNIFFNDILHEKRASKSKGVCGWVQSIFKYISSLMCCISSVKPKKRRTHSSKKTYNSISSVQKPPKKIPPQNKPKPSTKSSPPPAANGSKSFPRMINPGLNNCTFAVLMQGVIAIPSWRKALCESAIGQRLNISGFLNAYNALPSSQILQCSQYFDSMRAHLGFEHGEQIDVMDVFCELFKESRLPYSVLHRFKKENHRIDGEPTEENHLILNQTINNESLVELMINSFQQEHLSYKQFIQAPSELLIERQSLLFDYSLCDSLESKIVLPPILNRTDEKAVYECDFFIYHADLLEGGAL